MIDSFEAKDAINQLLVNQQQIHENIKFADQKAGAITAINTALLSVIYQLVSDSKPFTLPLGWYAALVLSSAIVVAIGVVWPRGGVGRSRGTGMVDAGRIAQFPDESAFIERCKTASDLALLREARIFVYDRARIDAIKYSWLRVSLLLSSFGWVLSFTLAAAVKFDS